MNKTKFLERLRAARVLMEDAFADLSEAETSQTGTFEHWSAKDTVAHIAAWNQRYVDWLRPLAEGKPFAESGPESANEDWERANARIFAENQPRSWSEIRDEARRAGQQMLDLVLLVSEEDLTDPQRFAWTNGRPLWRRINGAFVAHPQIHLAQLFFNRGSVARATQLAEAFHALMGADEPAPEQSEALYNLACCYALGGIADKAIENLRAAFALNPDLVEWSKQDTDLDAARAEPRFQALYEAGKM
jgi:tetratricopeptide (TPR) repeat protein